MTDAVLRAEQVEKSYNGLEVLRGVSLEVARGQVKVIIGPSGSGKSTLLRCLALLEPVDSGAVYLENERLSDRKEKALAAHRSEIGMVFQRFNLFPNMTALRNVMTALIDVRRLPKREARDRALHVAGWRVIRITWRQIEHQPDRIADDLRRLLLEPPRYPHRP